MPGWSWDIRTDQWEEGFDHLVRYAENTGHACVPRDHQVDDYPLGIWVQEQRTAHARVKGTKLTADREARLLKVPGWAWSARDAWWEEGFRRLLKFVEDNGHARVLDDHEVDGYKLGKKAGDPEIEGFKLGVWVTTQRRLFKKNGSLEGDREARLSAVEGWVWDARDAKWEESFRQLEDFVKVHGHARVPKSGDYGKLGTWVQLQRTAYKNDKLGPDREQRLLKVGWVPKTDWHNEQWENGFDHLLKYVADKGDACVPPTYKDADDDYPLGKWAQHQRSSQKNGKLNADREERLGELKGWGWATK